MLTFCLEKLVKLVFSISSKLGLHIPIRHGWTGSQNFGNNGEFDQRMITSKLITMVGIDKRKSGACSPWFLWAASLFWDLRASPSIPLFMASVTFPTIFSRLLKASTFHLWLPQPASLISYSVCFSDGKRKNIVGLQYCSHCIGQCKSGDFSCPQKSLFNNSESPVFIALCPHRCG